MDKSALVWLVFALICAITELATPIFGFILIGAAAVAAAAFAALGCGWPVQMAAFVIGATLALTILRARILAKLSQTPGVPSRTDKLLGRAARVTEAIDPATGQGRVLVDGHDWAAQAAEAIPAGADVRVEGSDGIKLKVKR